VHPRLLASALHVPHLDISLPSRHGEHPSPTSTLDPGGGVGSCVAARDGDDFVVAALLEERMRWRPGSTPRRGGHHRGGAAAQPHDLQQAVGAQVPHEAAAACGGGAPAV
jgi:hypothetical protein